MYDRSPDSGVAKDALVARRVDATVKWFNPTKGFGFVLMGDGSPDAFLPMAILRRAGYDEVREGAAITCEIGAGAKGPLVVNVIAVDNGAAAADAEHRVQRVAGTLEGAVKWFEPLKGYGFIAPDSGGKDVFIHVTALRRSGLTGLDPGQRVKVDVVDGKKGLEAERVILA
ncbi:MAG: cold-shock protein [Rhodospirillales bacterium]|nr:cold-shock protein [Rhodospirillales bacterium]